MWVLFNSLVYYRHAVANNENERKWRDVYTSGIFEFADFWMTKYFCVKMPINWHYILKSKRLWDFSLHFTSMKFDFYDFILQLKSAFSIQCLNFHYSERIKFKRTKAKTEWIQLIEAWTIHWNNSVTRPLNWK